MSEVTETNGATPTVKGPSCLDLANSTFKARKKAATVVEVTAALSKYLKADDAVKAQEEVLEKAKAARTEAAKEVVATRGPGAVSTKTRGTGRIMARGDSAWIAFSTTDGETIDV